MSEPIVICLTPVKNEAWILERFLKCASLWADVIIIADQNSNDGSREIAESFPKVILINNPNQDLNELERQRILLNAARQIDGPRLLMALDADEILTSNFNTSPEWRTIINVTPGTTLWFDCVQVQSDLRHYWLPDNQAPLGLMDDGSDHAGQQIHSIRIPLPDKSPRIKLSEIKVMHYQFTDWGRMRSKHRWYECWEAINNPKKSPVKTYRQYHHMDSIDRDPPMQLHAEWLQGYEEAGIDMTSVLQDGTYWWDEEVCLWIQQHGSAKFKKCDIWEKDWNLLGNPSKNQRVDRIQDPRSVLDKAVLSYLGRTQAQRHTLPVKVTDRLLRFIW